MSCCYFVKFQFRTGIRLLFLFLAFPSFAQNNQLGKVEVKIIDAQNHNAIPYASLYIKNTGKGTLSNFQGAAVLQNVEANDKVVCSFLGYESREFLGMELFNVSTIALEAKTLLIPEAVVLSDDDWLYDLLTSLKKNRNKERLTAKTYFELESFQDTEQIELFQGYFNAGLVGYDMQKLEMKSGRFALAPMGKRFFVSTETSRAFNLHHLLSSNRYFPVSPLDLKKGEMKDRYLLELTEQFKDGNGDKVMVVEFKPRFAEDKSFGGKMWIDSTQSELLKIELKISNAGVYPFESVYPSHELEGVDMSIRKEFEKRGEASFIRSIDFDYSYTYKPHVGDSFKINSRAVLHVFNYDEQFILPFFDFAQMSNSDFRKVNLLPYQKDFWECMDDFSMENELANQKFIESNEVLIDKELMKPGVFNERSGMFEQLYHHWSEKRIMFIGQPDSSNADNIILPGLKYELEAQLMLDINDECDTVKWLSSAIFDPYKSYFYLPTTPESLTFINIFFDLHEIKRRELEQELQACDGSIDCVKRVYQEVNASLIQTRNKYLREVDRGTKRSALKVWNELVKQKLKIDNIAYFELKAEG